MLDADLKTGKKEEMLERDGRILTTRIKTASSRFCCSRLFTAPRSSTPFRIIRRCRAPGCALITILTDVTPTLCNVDRFCGLRRRGATYGNTIRTCTTRNETWKDTGLCTRYFLHNKVHALHCMAVSLGGEGRNGGFDLRKTLSWLVGTNKLRPNGALFLIRCYFFEVKN